MWLAARVNNFALSNAPRAVGSVYNDKKTPNQLTGSALNLAASVSMPSGGAMLLIAYNPKIVDVARLVL